MNYLLASAAAAVLLLTPSVSLAATTIGNLEAIDASGVVTGWVYDPDAPGQEIRVALIMDGAAGAGTIVAQAQTSVSRPDVNAAYSITGNHGFSIPIPAKYLDGASHTLYAYGIDTDAGTTNVQMRNSPKPFSQASHNPVGALDKVTSAGIVGGWSYDPDNQQLSNVVDFYMDGAAGSGTFVGSVTANVLRADVNAALSIKGSHGFAFTVPALYRDGASHTLYAYGKNLSGTAGSPALLPSAQPFKIVVPAPPTIPPLPALPRGLTALPTSAVAKGFVKIDKGWDPGLLHRRAALFNTTPATYFESCPDDAGGCYKNGTGLPIGGGFYTFAPSSNFNSVFCKMNSGSLTDIPNPDGTTRKERCPFYFYWGSESDGRPIASVLVDSSSWSNAYGRNMYNGFQENSPQGMTPNGVNYLGGKNLPTIDSAYLTESLSGTMSFPEVDESRARFVTGIGWYVPATGKSYTIELNLGSKSQKFVDPALSTTARIAQKHECDPNVTCIILGGAYWGYPMVGTKKTTYSIDWAAIVKKLVASGDLPAASYGSYPANGFHTGTEVWGKAKSQLNVSNFHLESRVPASSAPRAEAEQGTHFASVGQMFASVFSAMSGLWQAFSGLFQPN